MTPPIPTWLLRPFFGFLPALALLSAPTISAEAEGEKAPLLPAAVYSALPSAQGAQLSPNGKQIGFISSIRGRKVIVLDDIEDDNAVVIPAIDGAELTSFRWANDARILAVYDYSQRNFSRGIWVEQTRLMGVDRNGSNPAWIVRQKGVKTTSSRLVRRKLPPAQLQDRFVDMLPDDPDHILLALDAEHRGTAEIWKIDVNTGEYSMFRDTMPGIQHWEADHTHALRYGYGFYDSRPVALLSDGNGDWIKPMDLDWYRRSEIVGFDTDPNILFILAINSYGTKGLYKLAIDRGEIVSTVFESRTADAGSLVLDPETGAPAGVTHTDDHERVFYFDEAMAKVQKTIDEAYPDTVNAIVDKAHGAYLFLSYSDTNPGRYHYYNSTTGTFMALAPTNNGIAPSTQAHVQAVSIPMRDGSSIPGYLTIPKGYDLAKGLKAVILPHGGPSGRDTADWGYLTQFLANRGYLVLQPNFRGSTGYGIAFETAGTQQWGGLMQDDVTDATKWLVQKGYADKDHICIAGLSYGGYAALMGVIKEPGLYKCAISVNGVMDIGALKDHDKNFIGGHNWIRDMGLKGSSDAAISPIHHVKDVNVPVLLMSALDDARVDYHQSKYMAKQLSHAHKTSRFVALKDGGHTLDTAATRETMLTEMEQFLKANLGD